MKNTKNSPGVFIPPPLFYVSLFLFSLLLQRYYPVSRGFFQTSIAHLGGSVIIAFGLMTTAPALRQFFKTKNTLITVKPATSLQTNGIYSVSRNPMYLGLLFVYLGVALIFGNWWTIILLPLLFVLINYFIILQEEKYLLKAFGASYSDYKKKVRRWL
ncbi:MAG: isoprenylcysteine carboxylmethyltransferase family protein [Bacteroidota bacterium]|nr:isoprenylcysteine carboxylmethyltransferase family protein [Bacteroidota bacterium]